MSEVLIESMGFDLVENTVEEFTEGIENKKRCYITGTYLVSNQINGNKRIYPKAVLEREVDRYIKEFIQTDRGAGELNHSNSSDINPERISHKILELKWDGDVVWGKSMICERTPMGQIAKGLMLDGIKLGTSSRAVGTLKSGIVQNDLRVITPSDLVFSPSGPNCYVSAIHENKEWAFANGILTELDASQIKSEADKIIIENKFSKEDQQAAFMKLFTNVMNNISNKIK